MTIELPWPASALAGHNNGHWTDKAALVAKHRQWAKLATLAAQPAVPATGDIHIGITFYPPDRRGDRVNYPNRMKPFFDGIAEALGVNDNRFLPRFHFAEPVKNPRVVVTIRESEAQSIGDLIKPVLARAYDAAGSGQA